tara:strand:- start:1315 stop:1755 length:441 start_codon:yes stop_codon:yes gene_type:complete
MNYTLDVVTKKPDLWKDGDPVRPELGVSFKTYPGREVFGLRDESGKYVAFCCVARTLQVPWDIMSLSSFTANDGTVYVPYTVWSLKKGSGKAIINALLDKVRGSEEDIRRVVTLSPRTDMARNFHLRNGAKEIAVHVVTANFEYEI